MTLEGIRGNITSIARDAWDLDDEQISEFRAALRSDAEDLNLSEEFEACTEERNFRKCLKKFDDENNVGGVFEGSWQASAPDELLDNLRDVGDAWGTEEREEARQIALDNDLDTLNRKCSRGQLESVQDQLDMDVVEEMGGPSNISNFAECVEAVSIAQDLSGDLQEAWDTNGS